MSTISFAQHSTNTGNAVTKTFLILPAAGITLALFYGMAALISSGPLTTKAPLPPIDISLMAPPPPTVVHENPKLPPPPPVVQAQPPRSIPTIGGEGEGLPTEGIQPPPVVEVGPGDFGIGGPADRGATPLVRINPKYPPDAVRDGVNGWVKLRFTIDEVGQVIDVEVIEAQPKRIFDREAVRALKGWKYQPQIENGVAVKQTGMQVQLDFNLDTEA